MRLLPLSVHTVTTVRLIVLMWRAWIRCQGALCHPGHGGNLTLCSMARSGRRDKYHLGEEKLFNTIKVSSFFIVYFRTLQVDKNFG